MFLETSGHLRVQSLLPLTSLSAEAQPAIRDAMTRLSVSETKIHDLSLTGYLTCWGRPASTTENRIYYTSFPKSVNSFMSSGAG